MIELHTVFSQEILPFHPEEFMKSSNIAITDSPYLARTYVTSTLSTAHTKQAKAN